jgi:hypothetical protein
VRLPVLPEYPQLILFEKLAGIQEQIAAGVLLNLPGKSSIVCAVSCRNKLFNFGTLALGGYKNE